MDAYPEKPKKEPQRLDARIQVILWVAICFAIAFVLSSLVVFVPPLYPLTPMIYMLLQFTWIPLVFWFWRKGRIQPGCLSAIVIMGWLMVCLAGLGVALWVSVAFAIGGCEASDARQGQIRYVCEMRSLDAPTRFLTMEGPNWSPILIVTGIE